MDLIEILKQKAFQRYSVNAVFNEKNNSYDIVNNYQRILNEDFFNHLRTNLSLPQNEKSLSFSFNKSLKGFKNSCVQAVIRHDPSPQEFDNYFHSFFKNFPLEDLFDAVYIKSNVFSNPLKKSKYQSYILYFLKQNYLHQKIYPWQFIHSLQFNFNVTKDNYPDLKESLFTFLSQHMATVTNTIRTDSDHNNHIDKKVKEFENSIYNAVSKFVNLEDMKMFSHFWPHILIKPNNKNMITPVANTFVFDLNFDYLSKTYPQITNESIANKTCLFVNNIINNYLGESLTSQIIYSDTTHSRFYIHFLQSLRQESIPEIIHQCIELKIKSNLFNDNYLQSSYNPIYEKNIESLKKYLFCIEFKTKLQTTLPAHSKHVLEKKRKI